MKILNNILIVLVVLISTMNTLLSQNFITTSAGANIVSEGLSIAENSPMQFGTMMVPEVPVQVVLSTGNGRISNGVSEISLFPDGSSSANACYTIGGSRGAVYAISLPVNGSVKLSNGSDQIEVTDFIAMSQSVGSNGNQGMVNSKGFDRFSVGATVNLNEGQHFGNYSGTFGISVNYN